MSYTASLGHTPQFSVFKGLDDISQIIGDRLFNITVQSRDGGGDSDTCSISLDDRGWALALPSLGDDSATLNVSMGYAETGVYSMGTFQVDQVELVYPPKGLLLIGNSNAATTAAKAPIITAYDQKTLGDIVRSIAASYGATAAIDPELDAIQVPYLNQHSSCGHLLEALERKYDALAKIGDGMLSFTKRGTGLNASGKSIGTFVLGPSDFGSYDIKLSNKDAFSNVNAAWFDRVNNQLQWVTSTVPGDPKSEIPFTIKRAFLSEDEAQRAANTQMSTLNRKLKTGTISLAKGDPSIRGGQSFTVAGTRDGLDGPYQIRCATHVLTKDAGIMTTLDVYDDGTGEAQSDDGKADQSEIPPSTIPTNGVGHN